MLPLASELFSAQHTAHAALLNDRQPVWQVLVDVEAYLQTITKTIAATASIHPTAIITGEVAVGAGSVIGPYAVIHGPTVIGNDCQIRKGAFIRGLVLIGDRVVVGHNVELKQSWLFNEVVLPHFNYVGDSVLGYRVHFGGGAIAANYRSDGRTVSIRDAEASVATGLLKCGAMIGDEVELGSQVILNPGTIIGRNTTIYPGSIVRGVIPPDSILKTKQTQVIIPKQTL